MRNLSTVRHRDSFDKPADFKDPYSSRAPDAGILEHERKRRVEVKCLELEISLQDDGVDEGEIEKLVSALRTQLLAQSSGAQGTERERGSIKVHERHELGQAKALANERLRLAMGISKDHVEGLAFDKAAQAEMKIKKQEEREQAALERGRIEVQLRAERDKANKERERQRAQLEIEQQRQKVEMAELARTNRETEMRRLDADLDARRPPSSRDALLPYDDPPRRRSPSPPRQRDGRSLSPRRRRHADSPSPSPPRRERSITPPGRRRLASRSRSPVRSSTRRGRSPTRSVSRSRSRSYSRSEDSRSRSPPRRRARRDSRSRSAGREELEIKGRARRRSPGLEIKGRARSRSPRR